MKLIKTPYPLPPPVKNKWFITIEWMSGDGDAYQKTDHEFKTKKFFIKAVETLGKIKEFSEKHPEAFRGTRVYLISEFKEFCQKYNCLKDYEKAKAFLGDYEYLIELYESVGIEPGMDCTHEGVVAKVKSIDLYHFDKTGKKWKIVVDRHVEKA